MQLFVNVGRRLAGWGMSWYESKKGNFRRNCLGDHGRIQTCNLLSRNQGLYSVKLRGRCCLRLQRYDFFTNVQGFVRFFFACFVLLIANG